MHDASVSVKTATSSWPSVLSSMLKLAKDAEVGDGVAVGVGDDVAVGIGDRVAEVGDGVTVGGGVLVGASVGESLSLAKGVSVGVTVPMEGEVSPHADSRTAHIRHSSQTPATVGASTSFSNSKRINP